MTQEISVADVRANSQRVLDAVQITDVRLKSLTTDSQDVPTLGVPLQVISNVAFKGGQRPAWVEAWLQYSLAAYQVAEGGEPELDAEPEWRAAFEIIVRYDANDPETIEQFAPIELQSFALGVAVMHGHPYARELAQSISARLGYPQLVLALVPSPLSQPDETIIELNDGTEGAGDS